MRSEFSGPGEVSPALRERLKTVADHYVAFGEIGIGQEGLWVQGEHVVHRLDMEFGWHRTLNKVLLQGEWNEVFDAVEIYLAVAEETAYHRTDEIQAQLNAAFGLSGSAYYIDEDGRVALRMEPDAVATVQQASKVLTPYAKAKGVFDEAVSGLLSRRARPEDVVKDVFVAFEEYLKQITGQGDFADAIKEFRGRAILTPTQGQLMEKLYGFRSETFGPTHAGKARSPTVADAVWFVETVSAQLSFLGSVVK